MYNSVIMNKIIGYTSPLPINNLYKRFYPIAKQEYNQSSNLMMTIDHKDTENLKVESETM